MVRAAIYARVSSAAQRERQTIAGQLVVLRALAATRGDQVAGEYIDDGRTAKAGHLEARDGLARLFADAVAGRFDVVLVLDIDRLTRSADQRERGAVLGTFQQAGVLIVTPSASYDLRSSVGDLLAAIGAWKAADDNRLRGERTAAGKLVAIAAGRKPSGPTPYGLRYSRERRTWSIDEDEAAIVREIYRRVAGGEPSPAIADDLTARGVARARSQVWTRERVYNLVRSTTYRGVWVADKARRLEVAVPAIVTAEQWAAADAALAAHGKRGLRRTRHVYLLEDLAVCGVCGARIGIASATARWSGRNGDTHGGAAARYVCAHRRRPPHQAPRCGMPYLDVAEVDGRLWAELQRRIGTGLLERKARERAVDAGGEGDVWAQDLELAQRQLGRLVDTERALLARFRRRAISEAAMDAELAAIGRERRMLELQVAGAERGRKASQARQARAGRVEAIIAELRRRLASVRPDERRALTEQLFEPGSVVLTATGRIYAKGRVGLAGVASTSSQAVTTLEFRLVV